MPLTDQDIRALVHLAVACRPHGAPRWDEAGIFASIAKVRNLQLADVALAVIRAADDAGAKTPGVIANTNAPNWAERNTTRPQPREPFDHGTFCGICSEPADRCARKWADDHEFVSSAEWIRRHETDHARRIAGQQRKESTR